jgi:hypothetical protein
MKRCLFLLASLVVLSLAASAQSTCAYCATAHPPCQFRAANNGSGCFCHFNGVRCTMSGCACGCDNYDPPLCTCFCDSVTKSSNPSLADQLDPNHHQPDTADTVRAYWAAEFKKDPSGQIEVFHVGGQGCMKQEIYVLGITQAGFDTGHAVYFTQSTEDSTPDRTTAKK